jgi:PhoH-like ATPase
MDHIRPLKKIPEHRDGGWGITPKNKEQNFAMDLLLDPDLPVVSLIGKAGKWKDIVCDCCWFRASNGRRSQI